MSREEREALLRFPGVALMQTARYVLPVCCLLLVLAGMVACTQAPPPTPAGGSGQPCRRSDRAPVPNGRGRDGRVAGRAGYPLRQPDAGHPGRGANGVAGSPRSLDAFPGNVVRPGDATALPVSWWTGRPLTPERIEATLAKRESVSPERRSGVFRIDAARPGSHRVRHFRRGRGGAGVRQ